MQKKHHHNQQSLQRHELSYDALACLMFLMRLTLWMEASNIKIACPIGVLSESAGMKRALLFRRGMLSTACRPFVLAQK